ncbi:MAG: SDR family NAD(P)-dependent oxidoreductase [Bacteroidales bacterium]|nr:SDR family NAD(P)-dependent oxidoreductase [Bacteroidales bacterium]MBN2756419.1 SDR family NAD(P)-dependent oxidoreductase [Bacteroidales bacterium]
MNKIALISGATSGIGRATALQLAENDYDVIITGRRNDRLIALKEEIKGNYKSDVLCLDFDIRNKNEVYKAIDSLSRKWLNIDVLINNAGLAAGTEPIHEGDTDNWEKMIDTNVKGLLYISKKIMPLMVERKKGHIVNIGSVAGKEVYLNGNVYCGSKHAVDAITKSMRIDLLPYNIRVTQIAPGAVETEFSIVRFNGDKEKAKSVYAGYEPLIANDIADSVIYVVTRPAHVNINDMLIMPTAQANTSHFNKKL